MTAQSFATMMALLAIVSVGGAVALAVGRFAGVRSLKLDVGQALTAAWAIATTATVGSLILSEVYHFTPCKLCWYQRIAMYPLTVLLGVAAWRRDLRSARAPALILVAVGSSLSIWHVLVQRFPDLSGSASCDPTAPCTAIWVDVFNVFTIPTMALAGFIGIAALLLTTRTES